MSETNNRPNKDGSLRGDDSNLPDRGTGIGWHGADPQLDGKSVEPEAINRIGSITSATKSDPAPECYSEDPTFGEDSGADRDRSY